MAMCQDVAMQCWVKLSKCCVSGDLYCRGTVCGGAALSESMIRRET